MVLGDIVCSWLLLRQAEVALEKLGGDAGKDQAFYEGKVAAAQFFARTVLPKITAERAIAEATDLSVMELDESRLLTGPLTDGRPPAVGAAASS